MHKRISPLGGGRWGALLASVGALVIGSHAQSRVTENRKGLTMLPEVCTPIKVVQYGLLPHVLYKQR